MTAIKLRIMVKACRIRVQNGETLDDVLDSYASLSDTDKAQIRAEFEA